MEETTESAQPASPGTATLMNSLMQYIAKAYYHLTVHIPRKLPSNAQEIHDLGQILTKYFGVKDDPKTWFTVSGQITSTPATKIRKPLSHFVNASKRLDINEIARSLRDDMINRNAERLKQLTENIVEAPEPTPIKPTEPANSSPGEPEPPPSAA